MHDPDNPMARPLSRAEEEHLSNSLASMACGLNVRGAA